MNENQKEVFRVVMKQLTKDAAKYDFEEFLSELSVTVDEWKDLSNYLYKTYGVKTYV